MSHLYEVVCNINKVLLRGFLFVVLFGLGASIASADTMVLKAGGWLDVRSGKVLKPAYIEVDGVEIVSVGTKIQKKENQKIIDLGDAVLLPGLMDMHTHITAPDNVGQSLKDVILTPADSALIGVANARKTLRAGFTTIRDVGAFGFADVSLARAINIGLVPGPDIFPAAHAIGIIGGHCDKTGYAPGIIETDYKTGIATGVDGLTAAVRYQVQYGAKVIKICATAGVLSYTDNVGNQQLSDEEIRAIVVEAERHGIGVAAHAHGAKGIKAAVNAGVASIEHGSILTDEIIELMKAKGTFLVPTEYLVEALNYDALPEILRIKARHILPMAAKSTSRAIKAGVRIAFGTDAAVFPHGDNAREFATLVGLGMSEIDAIQSATVNSAELLRINDRGEIAVGKLADIIAVRKNPLEDIRTLENVVFVMKSGVIHKNILQ